MTRNEICNEDVDEGVRLALRGPADSRYGTGPELS